MRTETENIKEFFETLGEIWRDVTLIEFLMRCALAQKRGEISKIPKPPFKKGMTYNIYPKSFSHTYFSEVVQDFNKEFPHLAIPVELVELRNAMAHGFIAEIDNSGVDEVVKFKKQKSGTLMVEFSMSLEQKKVEQIRQSLKELRRYVALEAADKPKNLNNLP
ncbi:MAG: hypothetical protein WC059_04000 [Candidatus Paceibacterota bacterium]